MAKQIIYYTCNTHNQRIDDMCREQLLKAANGIPIVSVSLNKDIHFGDKRIIVEGKRSPEMMHKQVLIGLRAATSDIIYLCESDVMYPPSHFNFTPEEKGVFYYNTNVWKYHTDLKKYTWTDGLEQVSGMCSDRVSALEFYERRNKDIEDNGFDGHYEAGKKTGEVSKTWLSAVPLICIRHENNITKTKKSIADFRNEKYAKGWRETGSVEGWEGFVV